MLTVLSHLTGPTAMALLAIVIAAVQVLRTRQVWWVAAPVAVLVANLLSHLLKAVIGRDRPPVEGRLIEETNFAFPSGHATAVAALATMLTVWWWPRHRWAIGLAWLAVLFVCWTRLYLGVHWVTDLLGGLVLGGAVSLATWQLFRPRIKP
ncbi:Putative undecaprenyl-diphosphatase YbjG [Corynebacterium atrinae]|uniref:phosphatase PAP2 family protein n=1 Tax=Corynebacterium atrinae TaxID=1336740 RepID=UPI0025B2E287|nr:phosphatase PAP2 family protein [Corynebacterium atrinae]WJY64544.1 Putative undecaprenyl-diphosphatase YbjG [Corynebacterium atrinae]